MIRSFQGLLPQIASSAYIDPSAVVIGDVIIGERSSVWANVSVRGDVNSIRIGDETSVQDNTVIHADQPVYQCLIGNRVTVGHGVILHGCVVEDDAVVGMGAIVLNGAKIGNGAVVAAGAVVPEGMDVPAGMLAMGMPAKVRREVSFDERTRFSKGAEGYVALAAIYLAAIYKEGQA
jgi:carbonic anhydrase/acetyltransferase-like protein (isoleucine patch superfamily)